jgi:predicted DNA-binding protein (UPF0251 family)
METDLKYFLKNFRLSNTQKRLLNAITREPTAHLYAGEYMIRHDLSRGRIGNALRRLKSFNLVSQEDGIWQVQPPELRRWWKVVLEYGQIEAQYLQFADISQSEAAKTIHSKFLAFENNLNNDRKKL